MDIGLLKEIARVDTMIWERHIGKSDVTVDTRNAVAWMQCDLAAIVFKKNGTVSIDELFDEIAETKRGSEILAAIDVPSIRREIEIRADYAAALKGVRNGRELSRDLRWSFGEDDLAKLAALHKQNRFRKKIEDLLEDCNFHEECSKFAAHNYDEFLEERVK